MNNDKLAPEGPTQPSSALFAWQEPWWPALAPVLAGGRLAHALLLSGAPGIGKRHLAGVLARALLCREPRADALPCGGCSACHYLDAGSHPDFFELAPDQPGKQILIDPAREFARNLQLTAQFGRRRVGLIAPAEALNLAAANSLLKTMEEPPPGVHILLVSERPGLLLPTIRSRCQQWRLPRPRADSLHAWLRTVPPAVTAALPVARNAPLRAMALARSEFPARQDALFEGLTRLLASGEGDPLALAAQWQTAGPRLLVDWLYLVLADILKVAAGVPATVLIFQSRARLLRRMAESLRMDMLRRFVPTLSDTRRLLETNVEPLLLLEALAIDLAACRKETA